MIVVDTSVLVDFFRGKRTTATEILADMDAEDMPFFIPTICCQELLQGAKNEKEWQLLVKYLSSQLTLEPRFALGCHLNAARLYYDCRRKGVTVRSTIDCFVAQLVLENKAKLLHDDKDFDRIAKIRPLKAVHH